MRQIAALLLPISWIYGAIAAWRRRRISVRARHLTCPVISVGNITCGGTGKTPTVEMVVRDLLELGHRPAILSRGYGAKAGQPNDEYRVLAENLENVPHLQGVNRYETGQKAQESGADVLVLDDGFQHVRVARDLDIVLIDALDPFGGGRVLPAGLLREPLAALSAADLIALTRTELLEENELKELAARIREHAGDVPFCHFATACRDWMAMDGNARPLDDLRGKSVVAFCGIGNPRSFRRQLEGLGLRIAAWKEFRDHHQYTTREIAALVDEMKTVQASALVMTQKDAVKLHGENFQNILDGVDACSLRIRQTIRRGEEEYQAALEKALESRA